MPVYKIPADNGKPLVKLPKFFKGRGKDKKYTLKSWMTTGIHVIIETTEEYEELKDYKI